MQDRGVQALRIALLSWVHRATIILLPFIFFVASHYQEFLLVPSISSRTNHSKSQRILLSQMRFPR